MNVPNTELSDLAASLALKSHEKIYSQRDTTNGKRSIRVLFAELLLTALMEISVDRRYIPIIFELYVLKNISSIVLKVCRIFIDRNMEACR